MDLIVELHRMKFISEYKRGEIISEQSTPSESISAAYKQYLVLPPDATRVASYEDAKSNRKKWPQYCSNNPEIWKHAIQIQRTINGRKLDFEESQLPNTCAYKAPKEGNDMGSTWVEIPRNVKMSFTTKESVDRQILTWTKKYPKQQLNVELTKTRLYNYVVDTPNTIYFAEMNEDGSISYTQEYTQWFMYNSQLQSLNFIGWWNGRGLGVAGKKLPQSKWVDPRKAWQRFVDEHQFLMITGSIVLGIIITLTSEFVGGTTAPWGVELLIEGLTGGIIAYRDLQKGDNIGAGMGVLFALLPVWKALPALRGVSDGVLKSIAKKFAGSDIKTADDYAYFVEFVLTKEERKILNKALSDENSWYTIEKALNGLKNPKEMKDLLLKVKDTYPELLNDIKWFKKIWAKI